MKKESLIDKNMVYNYVDNKDFSQAHAWLCGFMSRKKSLNETINPYKDIDPLLKDIWEHGWNDADIYLKNPD